MSTHFTTPPPKDTNTTVDMNAMLRSSKKRKLVLNADKPAPKPVMTPLIPTLS
jgi:hypothetical protein